VINSSAGLAKLADINGPVVVIISYALATKLRSALCRYQWDLLILDEAHALKSIDSKRTRAVYGKGGLITRTRAIWILTGTLAPNHAGELFPHYAVLLRGKLSEAAFIKHFCYTRETQWGTQVVGSNLARAPELAALFGPITLQRSIEELLPELPELHWGRTVVATEQLKLPKLTPEQATLLEQLEQGETLSASGQTALASVRRITGTLKAPAVAELVQNELVERDKIVVFAWHREVIEMITTAIGPIAACIHGDTPQGERQRLIDSFQTSPSPRVLVLQIITAGQAITLTAASRVIFSEVSWVPGDLVQAAGRLRRLGQRHTVFASVVSLAGSIDEVVDGVVMRKANELAVFNNLTQQAAA
jgi:SWI/SNF-related matrix-associated actin-dependent regulator of chromatin subfamily A-like protein 1